MTSNHAELFNTFLEAGKAMEELPIVRSDLVKAKIELDQVKTAYEDAQLDVMERDDTIAKLRVTLATREAELASATFREAEASAKINNLRAILGAGEPVPVVAAEPVGQPQAAASQGESSADAEPKQVYVDLAQDVDSGGSHGEWHMAEPNMQQVPKDHAAPLSGPGSQATTYGVVEDNKFISHDPTNEDSQRVIPTVAEVASWESASATGHIASAKPFANRPHWQKPSNFSWHDWVAGGGEKPYWMTDADVALSI